MSKKKRANLANQNVRGNDNNSGNSSSQNASGDNQKVNVNSARDERNKRRHDNIKKEEQHRWPKQL